MFGDRDLAVAESVSDHGYDLGLDLKLTIRVIRLCDV